MKKWGWILILFVAQVALFAQAKDGTLEDTIQKISLAWESPVEESLTLWKGLLSENAFLMIMADPKNKTELHAVGRDGFLRLMEMAQRSNPSIRHFHTTIRLELHGDVAYETAALENHKKNGDIVKSETFNIYKKEEAGWKILFAAPTEQMRAALAR